LILILMIIEMASMGGNYNFLISYFVHFTFLYLCTNLCVFISTGCRKDEATSEQFSTIQGSSSGSRRHKELWSVIAADFLGRAIIVQADEVTI
jgi:hypothetical protein